MKALRSMKLPVFMAFVMIIVLVIVSVVSADDISNNLDATVDAVAEVMSINVGGANGTTQLYVVPTNGDGKKGCNLTGSTILTVSVSSSNSSVATVSPSSITFGSCGDTPTLTVTPVSQGSATIRLTQTMNTTDATFDLEMATFTVNVAPPANTAPSVSISGVEGGKSYEIGSVPSAICNVTDAEDGNSSFPATISAVTGPLAAYGLGEQTASCSYTDHGGLPASASVTYGIVDTTKPVITLVSRTAANANGWNNGDVTVTWSCTDNGSGVVDATVTQTVSTDGADQSTTGTCEDHAGNKASDTLTGINIDTQGPVITFDSRTKANGNDWNNDEVTVTWDCTDSLSGPTDATVSQTVNTEGKNQSATGTCTDLAGNSVSDTQSGISIDKTAPTASASALPAANANGWNNTDVTVSFSGTDSLSGIASCSAAVVLSDEKAGQSASGTCTDKAGNVSAAASASGINIDKTAPTVSLVGGPADGGTYYFNFVPAAPTCSASDTLSGLDGDCAVSGYSTALGSHTVMVSATDKAGNSASASATYSVLAWTFGGFYQPVDMSSSSLTVWNTVKNGSTVPLKFELFAGPTEITSTSSIVQPLRAVAVSCNGNTADDIELTTSGATVLRYDTAGGQFIYNWQTPKTPGACYLVTVKANDGSSISAYFKLK